MENGFSEVDALLHEWLLRSAMDLVNFPFYFVYAYIQSEAAVFLKKRMFFYLSSKSLVKLSLRNVTHGQLKQKQNKTRRSKMKQWN